MNRKCLGPFIFSRILCLNNWLFPLAICSISFYMTILSDPNIYMNTDISENIHFVWRPLLYVVFIPVTQWIASSLDEMVVPGSQLLLSTAMHICIVCVCLPDSASSPHSLHRLPYAILILYRRAFSQFFLYNISVNKVFIVYNYLPTCGWF